MKKQTHLAVDYRDGSQFRRCATCKMYIQAKEDDDPHCTAVADPIRPAGVCDIYKAKQ